MMLTASALAVLALKSLVIAGVTLCLLRLARKRTPAERSVIAHLGLLALLVLPLASLALPQWSPLPSALLAPDVQQPAIARQLVPAAVSELPLNTPAAASAATPAAWPSLADLALWAYAIPLALMLTAMGVAVLRLFAMRRRAEVLVEPSWLSALAQAQRRMCFKNGTALLVSEELRSPISWGVLRPTILLDPRAVATVRDAEAIIAHELAHVARLDWAKLLLARLTCALFWFNPLVWLLARESHQLREEAADDSVLLTDIAGTDYASLLVNAARHDNRAVLIAAHGVAPAKNSLRRRITRALDGEARRAPVGASWSAVCLLAGLAIAAPVAAFSTTVAERPDTAKAIATTLPVADSTIATAGSPEQEVRIAQDAQPALSPEDLVSMRAVGVTPESLAEMRDERDEVQPDEVVAAHATGTSADYIGDMRSIFGGVDVGELIGARAVGVDAAYARAMRAALPAAGLDEIIGARAIGITPQYARSMRAVFPRIGIEDLIAMQAHGITARDVQAMRRAGLGGATPDEVVALHVVGGHRTPRPPRRPPDPPSVRVTNGDATAIVGPGGLIAAQGRDGTTTTVTLGQPPGHTPHD